MEFMNLLKEIKFTLLRALPRCRSGMRLMLLPACTIAWSSLPAADYAEVRAAIFSDAYPQWPHYSVDKRRFGPSGEHAENALRAAAQRTLEQDFDLFESPGHVKLFQANGICYAARWEIDAISPYTGLFRAGTRVRAIVRLSIMLSDIQRGQRRTLGMGIKLFVPATTNEVERSENILVMDQIAGSRDPYVLQAPLDNHPDLGGLPSFGVIGTAIRIRNDLDAVDKRLSPAGPALRYRSLEHIAAALNTELSHSPHWIRLTVAPGTRRVDAQDFREELSLKHYRDGTIVYDIAVAAHAEGGKAHAAWQTLGRLTLVDDVVSMSCDKRLHFAHPKLHQAP